MKNLTIGSIYGNFEIIEKTDLRRGGEIVWRCKCLLCNKQTHLCGSTIRGGYVKSCGCLSKPGPKNLTGSRFGKLLVVKYVGKDKKLGHLWECVCDCGVVSVKSQKSLNSIKGCGICRKNNPDRYYDLVGKRFGHLVVVDDYIDHDTNGGRVLGCRCDCGKYRRVRLSSLTSGNTKGCGYCGHRKHGLARTKAYRNVVALCRRERSLFLDNQWTPLMEMLLREFMPRCIICGAYENLATDHVKPLSKGYGLYPGNAVRLCRICNGRKQAQNLTQLPLDWQNKIVYAAEQFRLAWSGGF